PFYNEARLAIVFSPRFYVKARQAVEGGRELVLASATTNVLSYRRATCRMARDPIRTGPFAASMRISPKRCELRFPVCEGARRDRSAETDRQGWHRRRSLRQTHRSTESAPTRCVPRRAGRTRARRGLRSRHSAGRTTR